LHGRENIILLVYIPCFDGECMRASIIEGYKSKCHIGLSNKMEERSEERDDEPSLSEERDDEPSLSQESTSTQISRRV
jgi:hypothetical protein